jgi:hypothetical protein
MFRFNPHEYIRKLLIVNRVMLTTLAAPRAISADPPRCRTTSWSCHAAAAHLGAANQPSTAHLDPATHLHIFMLGMSVSKLDILNYVQTAKKFIQLR